MLHVLDTDVVSNLRKRTPNERLLNWLKETRPDEIGIPLVVVFEVQLGIESLRRGGKIEKAIEVEDWLEKLLKSRDGLVLSPGLAIARLQARMFADPGLRGFLCPEPKSQKLKFGGDLIVAATAIVHGAAVVSFNDADYFRIHQRYPLPGLFHPGRPEWVIPPKE